MKEKTKTNRTKKSTKEWTKKNKQKKLKNKIEQAEKQIKVWTTTRISKQKNIQN